MDPLEDANEMLKELEGAALRTSQGSFVRVEAVEAMLKRRAEARMQQMEDRMEQGPPPKTFDEARRRAARDLKEAFPSSGPREPGKSVQAQPSRGR